MSSFKQNMLDLCEITSESTKFQSFIGREETLSLYFREKEVYIRSALIANDRNSAPGILRKKKKDEKDGEEVELALTTRGDRMAHFRYSWIQALKQHIRALPTHLSLHLLLYVFWLHTQEEESMATHGSMFLSFTIQVERSFSLCSCPTSQRRL